MSPLEIIISWYAIGFILCIICTKYVDGMDVTIEELIIFSGLSFLGPILFVVIFVDLFKRFLKSGIMDMWNEIKDKKIL